MFNLDWNTASLPLRIATGLLFAVHGWPKITDLKAQVNWLRKEGFILASFLAFCLSVTEFFGGIALAAGFLTQIVAGLLFIDMTVALYKHIFSWNDKFKGGYELAFILWTIAFLFVILAAGSYSLDAVLNLPIF